MLIAVPPPAAATRGPRGTAVSAVVCLGLQLRMAARRPGHFEEQHHVAVCERSSGERAPRPNRAVLALSLSPKSPYRQ